MRNRQILLPGFAFRLDADFDSFFAGEKLHFAKTSLETSVREQRRDCIYLAGAEGSGKSHLLQAACNLAIELDRSAIYLPLRELKDFPPEHVLEGVASIDVIAIDDVDAIVGNEPWQEAVFHLYNQRFSAGRPLYFAAAKPARLLALELADLQSRLAACLAFQLTDMDDDEKAAFLQFLAKRRGMELNLACANYIIQRYSRSNGDIIKVLEQLDQATLIAKRKITVPFIKELLAS